MLVTCHMDTWDTMHHIRSRFRSPGILHAMSHSDMDQDQQEGRARSRTPCDRVVVSGHLAATHHATALASAVASRLTGIVESSAQERAHQMEAADRSRREDTATIRGIYTALSLFSPGSVEQADGEGHRRGGRGKGKGVTVLKELVKATKKRYCWGYNRADSCTDAALGGECRRGWHLCMVTGCDKPHPKISNAS